MKPVEFKDQTALLNPPKDWERGRCGALPIRRVEFDGVPYMQSFWRPSKAELAQLNAGGFVRLSVAGTVHPPVSVQTEEIEALP